MALPAALLGAAASQGFTAAPQASPTGSFWDRFRMSDNPFRLGNSGGGGSGLTSQQVGTIIPVAGGIIQNILRAEQERKMAMLDAKLRAQEGQVAAYGNQAQHTRAAGGDLLNAISRGFGLTQGSSIAGPSDYKTGAYSEQYAPTFLGK